MIGIAAQNVQCTDQGDDVDTGGAPQGWGDQASATVTTPWQSPVVVQPSLLPLIGAGLTLVASVVCLILHASPWPLVGYALTPFGTVACLVWARSTDLRQMGNPWYNEARGRMFTRIIQILVGASFILAALHAWQLAKEVALWIA